MHTAICAFDNRLRAEQARDSLVQAGFARNDVHIEHKHATSEGDADDRWDGLEREVAVDRNVLKSFGNFFASLFGRDNPSDHADRYSQQVERGSYVVVVDGVDAAEAERAQNLLAGLEAVEVAVVYRVEQPPLRDLVAARGASTADTAGTAQRSAEAYENTQSSAAGLERERAIAADGGMGAPRAQEPRDDLSRAPGLRYSDQGQDKDKPNG
jgi:hypothetical protein